MILDFRDISIKFDIYKFAPDIYKSPVPDNVFPAQLINAG